MPSDLRTHALRLAARVGVASLVAATLVWVSAAPAHAEPSRQETQTDSSSSEASAEASSLSALNVDRFELAEPQLGAPDDRSIGEERPLAATALEVWALEMALTNRRLLREIDDEQAASDETSTASASDAEASSETTDNLENRVEILDRRIEKLRQRDQETLRFSPGRLQGALWISFGALTVNGLAASLYGFKSAAPIALTTSANAAVSLLPAAFTGLSYGSGNTGLAIISTVVDVAAAAVPWAGAFFVRQLARGNVIEIN